MRSRWREISSTVVSINSAASPLSPRTKRDRKSTRLNSSHSQISYAVFCLKKKNKNLSHELIMLLLLRLLAHLYKSSIDVIQKCYALIIFHLLEWVIIVVGLVCAADVSSQS